MLRSRLFLSEFYHAPDPDLTGTYQSNFTKAAVHYMLQREYLLLFVLVRFDNIILLVPEKLI